MALPHSSEKVSKNFDSFTLKFYKSSCTSSNFQRLPKCWNTKDRSRCLRLSHFALTVAYSSSFNERHESNYNQDVGCVRADNPIPLTTGIYYFEITLLSKGTNGSLSVGLTMKTSSLNKFPGSEHNSFGYQSDGCLYHGSPSMSTKFGPPISENDTVGCGIDFMSQSLFFTRNGIFLGRAFEGKVPIGAGTRLFPTVGLTRGIRFNTNFGQRPFQYAFDNHIKNERRSQENKLVERICKEEFAGPKMRELVSGYLVHHGYVATARAFSHWSTLLPQNTPLPINQPMTPDRTVERSGLIASASETNVGASENLPKSSTNIQRRHSDSACLGSGSPIGQSNAQLPGIASMLHRRRLRALCRRCQYGKAAATLNRLYPQVLERCPELLVQLRCRQLIEMMHRHAVRRGRNTNSETISDCNSSSATTVPPKVQKIIGSSHVGSGCCVNDKVLQCSQISSHQSPPQTSVNGATDKDSMDLDGEDVISAEAQQNLPENQDGNHLTDFEDELDPVDMEDDDDDGFGLEDEATSGVLNSSQRPADFHNPPLGFSDVMDVDSQGPGNEHSNLNKDEHSGEKQINSSSTPEFNDEMRCLLRHVQFGRSLVSLVKQVRAKTGGLSLETERLLQQSVSLLAYPSPTSRDCPLRGLLDPVWRDTIASIINSAVLKAHDLPAQPALEQSLRILQHCFQDPNFVEAQTLGHFLLYHLSPAQLSKVDEEITALESISHHPTSKRSRAANSTSQDEQPGTIPTESSSAPRRVVTNGHASERRRTRHRRRPLSRDASEEERSETTDGCASSLEDRVNKDDDDDEDEDEEDEEGRCDSDDDDDDIDDNDDDDDDVETSGPSRRPHTRSRQIESSGFSGTTDHSETRGSNGGSSGRVRSGAPVGSSSASFSLPNNVPISSAPPNIRLGRQTVLTRYCPTLFVDSSGTRVVNSIPPSLPTMRQTTVPSRRFITSGSTNRNTTRSSVGGTSIQNNSSNADNHYVDSAFRGLFSSPHHAEFLAAMDDALKAYTASLLFTEDEQSFLTNSQSHQSFSRGGPPSPTGGGAFVP